MTMLLPGVDDRTLPALARIACAIHDRHGAPTLARDVLTAAAATNTGWLRAAAERARQDLQPESIADAIALLAKALEREERGHDPGAQLDAAARAAEGDLDGGRDYLVVGLYTDDGGRYAASTRAPTAEQAARACVEASATRGPLQIAAVIDTATGQVAA